MPLSMWVAAPQKIPQWTKSLGSKQFSKVNTFFWTIQFSFFQDFTQPQVTACLYSSPLFLNLDFSFCLESASSHTEASQRPLLGQKRKQELPLEQHDSGGAIKSPSKCYCGLAWTLVDNKRKNVYVVCHRSICRMPLMYCMTQIYIYKKHTQALFPEALTQI